MKAKILELLRERADYVSGQEICESFQVSRTAVWKAVNQLKKEGYEIEAVQNKGYRLKVSEDEQDIYGQNELTSRIHTKWVGKPAHFYESLGSTNVQAKMEAESGAASGTLIVADRQTAGRGRRGRSWNSPDGANIYFTLLLKPEFAPDKASMLTIVMAMAVETGIRKCLNNTGKGRWSAREEGEVLTDDIRNPVKEKEPAEETSCENSLQIGIKWPNDIVINGKKVCGILTEMSMERDYIQHVVIGVGINVKKQEFPPEITQMAAALEPECGVKIARCELIGEIMQAFEEYYERFLKAEDLSVLKNDYNAVLVNKDREVCVLDPKGEFKGVARGIDDAGELLVEREDHSTVKVYAGEVSVRGIYGYVT